MDNQQDILTVLVTGSRYYNRKIQKHFDELSVLIGDKHAMLIHGGALGADKLAANEASSRKWQVKEYPAEWSKYGKSAGPKRNQLMVDANPHIALVILANNSVGTVDCMRKLCKKYKEGKSNLQWLLMVSSETNDSEMISADTLTG